MLGLFSRTLTASSTIFMALASKLHAMKRAPIVNEWMNSSTKGEFLTESITRFRKQISSSRTYLEIEKFGLESRLRR